MKVFLLATFLVTLGWADALDDEIIKDLDFFQQIEMVKTQSSVPLEAFESLSQISDDKKKEALNFSQSKEKIK